MIDLKMSRQGVLLDALFIAAMFYALLNFFPYFPKIHSANELSRVYLAESIAERHEVMIDKSIKTHGMILDRSERDGQTYSDKAPGVSFVAAFIYQLFAPHSLSEKVWLARLAVSYIPLVMILIMLSQIFRRRALALTWRWSLLSVLVFGSHMGAYGILAFGHTLAACLLFVVYMLMFEYQRYRIFRMLMLGFCGAVAVVTEYPMAVYVLLLGLCGLWARKIHMRDIPVLFVGGALPLYALAGYHQAAFGDVFKTGYSFIVNKHFSAVHAQGFMGITYPKPKAFALSFLSTSKGLLFFFPVWLLALGQIGRRANRVNHYAHQALVVTTIIFVVSMVFPGGGWTVSQRHFIPMMPFMALLLMRALEDNRLKNIFPALYLIACCQGTLSFVWPHFDSRLRLPIREVAYPLWQQGYALKNQHLLFMSSQIGIALAFSICLLCIILIMRLPSIRRGFALTSFMIIMAIYGGLYMFLPGTSPHKLQQIRSAVEDAYAHETAHQIPSQRIWEAQ